MQDLGAIGGEAEIRVFISSPSDVGGERARAVAVLKELSTEFAGRYRFTAVSWPESYYSARETFQDAIPPPSSCDIVVCILWKRLGTDLPPKYNRPDGSARTGTEYEFEEALGVALQKEIPDVLVYRKTSEVLISAQRLEIESAELRALQAFWQRWFQDEQGHFTAGFDTFEKSDEFAEKLRRHLRLWLKRRSEQVRWSIALKGSPFRGLKSFDADHAEVFFGRRRAIRQVIARLQACAASGCGFLLLLGMSGAGKSSLVKAGVVPWLVQGRALPQVDEWRSAIIRPNLLAAGPLLRLSEALFDAATLPELGDGDYRTPELLAALLRDAPSSAPAPILSALRRAGEAARARDKIDRAVIVRLVLVFDQFEEFLSLPAAGRDAVIAVIDSLARSGEVLVIATLRSDFYSQFQAVHGLLKLKDDGGSFDLLPPAPAEIREIIHGPARAAGLVLEEREEVSLADLLEDAAQEPGSLPLLGFAMESLFLARDVASNTLLLKSYKDIGGLEGAIAHESEKFANSLPESLLAVLPRLLLGLVEVDEATGTARTRVLAQSSITNPNQVELVDRLIQARFLVVGGIGAQTVLWLAHDALLKHWPRLSKLVETHFAFLAWRTRLERDASLWERERRDPDFLLPAGRRLAGANQLLAQRKADLSTGAVSYIEASQARFAAAERSKHRRNWIWAGAAVFAAVAVALGAFRVIEEVQMYRARAAAVQAMDLIRNHRYREAIGLALQNLPRKVAEPDRPLDYDLLAVLELALERNRLEVALAGHEREPTTLDFAPSGEQLVTASADGSALLWNIAARTHATLGDKDSAGLCCARFDPAGSSIAVASRSGAVRVFRSTSGELIATLAGATSEIRSIAFDATGETLFAASQDGKLRAWNARTGGPRFVRDLMAPVNLVIYQPGKNWIATFADDATVRLWNSDGTAFLTLHAGEGAKLSKGDVSSDGRHVIAASSRQIWLWDISDPSSPRLVKRIDHALAVNSVVFDSTGGRILSASSDHTARLWSAESGEPVGEVMRHDDRVMKAIYAPGGDRIATVGFDDMIRIWDARTGMPLDEDIKLRDGTHFVSRAGFHPSGKWLVTTAQIHEIQDPSIRLWNIAPKEISQLKVGRSAVRRVAFCPDGRLLATASLDGEVRIWDAHSLKPVGMTLQHDWEIFSVAFDASCSRVVTGAADGTARVWNLSGGDPIELKGHDEDWIVYAAFDPAGERVVTASRDGTARIFDVATKKTLHVLRQDDNKPRDPKKFYEMWSAVFSPSGDLVLTAAEDGTATLWDAKTGERKEVLGRMESTAHHTGPLNWATFSTRGDKAITVSDDHTARLWNVSDGAASHILQHADDELVLSAAFHPRDNVVVTSTTKSRLYFWDVSTGRLLAIKIVHDPEIIYFVAFDPSGDRLITASRDGTARLIDTRIDLQSIIDKARVLAPLIQAGKFSDFVAAPALEN